MEVLKEDAVAVESAGPEIFGIDFKQLTLDWAASVGEGQPSQRIEFFKRFISLLPQDELRRAKGIIKNKRRDFGKLDKNPYKKSGNSTRKEIPSSSAVSSFKAVRSLDVGEKCKDEDVGPCPWFEPYLEAPENIVALDAEFVSKLIEGTEKKPMYDQHIGTIDIVDFNMKLVYSRKVFHSPGSFLCNRNTRALTNFNENTFSSPMLQSERTVQEEVKSLLQNKLIITCAGENDFKALGLEMADFDCFDLQSHFYLDNTNEHGVVVRQPHSLRSLSADLLKKPQSSLHTSKEDAMLTMELFKVYMEKKRELDPNFFHCRVNNTSPYNMIKVLPHPLKTMFKKKNNAKQ